MKKILSFAMLFLVVLSTFSIFGPQVKAQEAIMFEDNFESYDVGTFPSAGGWELWFDGQGSQHQVIVDTLSVSGTKSLKLWGRDWWSAVAAKPFTVTGKIGYEVMIRAENWGTGVGSKSGASATFGKKMSATISWSWANVEFYGDGYIRSSGQNLQPYSLNTWYRIKVIYNSATNNHSVWINDELKATSLPNEHPPTDMLSFALGSNHLEQVCYFDDVKVAPPPVAPDFEISVSPDYQMVTRGQSVSYTVIVQSSSGFSSAVSLALDGLPPGTSFTFDSPSVVPNGTSTLTVTTSSSTPFGIYTLNITGTSEGTTRSTIALLLVEAVFYFPYSSGFTGGSSDQSGIAKASYKSDVNILNGWGETRIFARAALGGYAKSTAFFELRDGGESGSSSSYTVFASFTIDGIMQALAIKPGVPAFVFVDAVLKAELKVYDQTLDEEVGNGELMIFEEFLGGAPFPSPLPITGRTERYNRAVYTLEIEDLALVEGHEYYWSFGIRMEGAVSSFGLGSGWAAGIIDTTLSLVSISPTMMIT